MPNYLINMKRIILTTSLFFCLTITTILAQVVTTNIAAPDSNGFSNNQVSDFDINSDGTILNNSATNGTATLGSTAVTANPNITAGNEASLILLQVTGTSGSDLDGTIEVFGAEAGLIIANPNGIVCDGCAFINTNRVDLVTGSGYDADTNRFGTIAATDITVEGGALDAVNVDFLHIQTGRYFINSTTIDAESLSITAGVDFTNYEAISANTLTIEVTNFANYVYNAGTVTADSLNFILTDDFSTSATSFNAFNFSNLAITTDATFTNNSDIDLDGNLTITANNFTNAASINIAGNFTITVNSFSNTQGIFADTVTIEVPNLLNNISSSSNIDAKSVHFIFTDDFLYTGSVLNYINTTVENLSFTTKGRFTNFRIVDLAGSFTVRADSIGIGNPITAATVTLEAPNFANDISIGSPVSAASLNFILTDDFTYTSDSFAGFNNFSNLAITTEGTFTSSVDLDLVGSLTVKANSIYISNPITADTVTFEVPNFVNDITNASTVSSDSLNFILTDDFTYTSTTFSGFNNFSNLAITTDGTFTNNDTIDLDGNLAITANSFDNSGGVVSADTFSLSVAGAFDYGTVTTNALNLQVGGDFNYDDSANDFTWRANDSLTVLGNFNIVAAGFENSGNINVTNSLNVTANTFANTGTVNADTITIEVTNFVNNIQNTGTVSSASLNFILTDDFTHSSTSFANFNFSNLAITTEGTFTNNNAIDLAGNLTITTGYTAINQGSIVSGSLDVITADFFRNLTGGDINVANLNIIAGGKVTNTANINVGTLTITANNDSTRTNDTTGFYVSNRGNITATSLNIAAVDNFYNRGNITATNFNITRAKSVFFLNREIDSFYAAGNTYDGGDISLSGNSSFIAADGSIENYGNIDLGVFNLDISADSFTNQAGANVTANTLNLDVSSFVQNGTVNATVNQ